MQGFKEAQAEYEAKLNNPFENEYDENVDEDDYFIVDIVEERMLENQVEDYLWH